MTTKFFPPPKPDPKITAPARKAGHAAALAGRPYAPNRWKYGTNEEWRAYQDGYAAGEAERAKRDPEPPL